MGKVKVLLLSNHPSEAENPGQIDALRVLVKSGELGGASVVHAGASVGESPSRRTQRVVRQIHESDSDVVLVLSMKDLVQDVDAAAKAIAGRPVVYWEGDPWGRGKRVSQQMAAWLELSDYVFSVGGPPQAQLLMRNGASTVHHTIHTYDHVLFGGSECGCRSQPTFDVGFIGSNLSRFPLVSGLPGSMGRWRVVGALQMRYGGRFLLGGPGWPSRWSTGPIEFGAQDRFMKRSRLLVNWDHYPRIDAYTSDRMAICMIAGRPQVSTLHPEMDWLPGEQAGLFLESTVGGVIRRTHDLLALPESELNGAGIAAYEWAKGRISHREAIRHMLSIAVPHIDRPPADPWDALPGPWVIE